MEKKFMNAELCDDVLVNVAGGAEMPLAEWSALLEQYLNRLRALLPLEDPSDTAYLNRMINMLSSSARPGFNAWNAIHRVKEIFDSDGDNTIHDPVAKPIVSDILSELTNVAPTKVI